MREHGTRAKYVAERCRCDACTEANRLYARERDRHQRRVKHGIEDERHAYVDATETRNHLRWLSSVGVGKRTVQRHTGVGLTTIEKIRAGKVTKCRETTANKILAVGRSKAASGAYVDARNTWRKIDDLIKHGWTKAAISAAIGNNGKALQLGRTQVSAKNAKAIAELHDRAMFRIVRDREIVAERRAHYRQPEREAAA